MFNLIRIFKTLFIFPVSPSSPKPPVVTVVAQSGPPIPKCCGIPATTTLQSVDKIVLKCMADM